MSSPSSGSFIPTNTLNNRIERIKERINLALERSARPLESVQIMAVTKTVPVNVIEEAIRSGIRIIGENRVQEAETKLAAISQTLKDFSVSVHGIGGLQTNKAKKAVELFDVIESIDRPKLALFVDRAAAEAGKIQRCTVEVKVSDEPTKGGVPLEEAEEFIGSFERYKNLKLEGLMTIGKLNASREETRKMFRQVRDLFDRSRKFFGDAPVLSMGMSDDFETAIEEGATMVRLGRVLFGERTA